MRWLFQQTGRRVLGLVEDAGYTVALWIETLRWTFTAGFFRLRAISDQLYICGVQSVIVTLIVGLFTGMIITLQMGLVLKQYQIHGFIGMVVMITMLKELGPFMCAFILAGRVGSAMSAELGTMAVSEEIDALKVMSINPVKLLVMPRFVALTLMAPILTIFADIVGVLGGSVVAKYRIGVSYTLYYKRIWEYLQDAPLSLLYGGMVKAMVFGMLISIIGCANGLRATRGAEGVGQASRRTVVDSFLLILILNYFMSSILNTYF